MRRRFAIYGSGAGGGEVQFQEQTVSVDLNGDTEGLGTATETAIGIVNVWSIGIWFKPTDDGVAGSFSWDKIMCRIGPNVGTSRIDWELQGGEVNAPYWLNMSKEPFGTLKRYTWESQAVEGAWNFAVITWDGTDLLLYQDGAVQTPTTTPIDDTGAQSDSDRGVWVHQNSSNDKQMEGRIHSMGIWSVAMASGEIAELFSGASAIDWASSSGDYVSSASLQHWWRFGHDSGDIGKDYGKAAVLKDTMDDAENITAGDDIVTDAP